MDNTLNKHCIFHVPLQLRSDIKSASNIRPIKMIEAFRSIGYNVDVVMGDSGTRRKQITAIKHNIKRGMQYDFVYAESSTMPNALTDQDHVPRAPFLDCQFFKYCKNKGIPVGLFYRDVYWMYEAYLPNDPIKATLARFFYKVDIRAYRKCLSALFLPDAPSFFKNASVTVLPMAKPYIEVLKSIPFFSLPPGCEKDLCNYGGQFSEDTTVGPSRPLKIFYVGGIGGHYDLHPLLEATKLFRNCMLTLCVREKDWIQVIDEYAPFLNERTKVVHAAGADLGDYYRQADICSLVVGRNDYWAMAVPYKLYEYATYGIPIVATNLGIAADIIEHNRIGWIVEPTVESICELLAFLTSNPSAINEKKIQIMHFAQENTWECRAQNVAKILRVSE